MDALSWKSLEVNAGRRLYTGRRASIPRDACRVNADRGPFGSTCEYTPVVTVWVNADRRSPDRRVSTPRPWVNADRRPFDRRVSTPRLKQCGAMLTVAFRTDG